MPSGWLISKLHTAEQRQRLVETIERFGGWAVPELRPPHVVGSRRVRLAAAVRKRMGAMSCLFYVRAWDLDSDEEDDDIEELEMDLVGEYAMVNVDADYVDCVPVPSLVGASRSSRRSGRCVRDEELPEARRVATSSEHGYLWHDWQSFYAELPASGELSQSYQAFCRGLNEARESYGPSGKRDRLYVVQVSSGKQAAVRAGDVALVGQLLQVYFGLSEPVQPLVGERLTVVRERGELGIRLAKRKLFYPVQVDERGRLLATDVLAVLADVLPQRAVSLLGLIDDDLYEWPDDDGQFWGRGCGDRVAVVSSYHFRPRGREEDEQQLARLANVCVHELCHTFQLDHCAHVRCLMNASEPRPAALDDTLPLCPICLPKLQRVFAFDVAERYRRLAAFLARPDAAAVASPAERRWYARRADGLAIGGGVLGDFREHQET